MIIILGLKIILILDRFYVLLHLVNIAPVTLILNYVKKMEIDVKKFNLFKQFKLHVNSFSFNNFLI